MIGTSRKSFLGRITGREDPAERLAGTIATCVIAYERGARCSGSTTSRRSRDALLVTAATVAPMDDEADEYDEVDDEEARGSSRARGHDRDQRTVAVHPRRRDRGRARGRPAAAARPPDRRRASSTRPSPTGSRTRSTTARSAQLANLVAQQRTYKTLERLCAAIADRLLEQYDGAGGVGQGGKARAADGAAGHRGLGRGVARGRVSAGAAGARTGYLGLGSNVGDRRAHLEAAVAALPRARRDGARLVLGVRDRARRADPRPARLPQRVPADRDRARARSSCSTRARRSSASWDAPPGGVAPRPAADRRRRAAARRADYRSERLTLPHREVRSRRFVLVPLLELDPELTLPDGDARWPTR